MLCDEAMRSLPVGLLSTIEIKNDRVLQGAHLVCQVARISIIAAIMAASSPVQGAECCVKVCRRKGILLCPWMLVPRHSNDYVGDIMVDVMKPSRNQDEKLPLGCCTSTSISMSLCGLRSCRAKSAMY